MAWHPPAIRIGGSANRLPAGSRNIDGISPVVGFQIPHGAQNGGKLQIVPGDLLPQPVRFIRVPHPGAQGGKRKLGDMGVAM